MQREPASLRNPWDPKRGLTWTTKRDLFKRRRCGFALPFFLQGCIAERTTKPREQNSRCLVCPFRSQVVGGTVCLGYCRRLNPSTRALNAGVYWRRPHFG